MRQKKKEYQQDLIIRLANYFIAKDAFNMFHDNLPGISPGINVSVKLFFRRFASDKKFEKYGTHS